MASSWQWKISQLYVKLTAKRQSKHSRADFGSRHRALLQLALSHSFPEMPIIHIYITHGRHDTWCTFSSRLNRVRLRLYQLLAVRRCCDAMDKKNLISIPSRTGLAAVQVFFFMLWSGGPMTMLELSPRGNENIDNQLPLPCHWRRLLWRYLHQPQD